ncbi:hypothetical protein OIV83_000213 [Microbotryomycetes sp. JL201]|nr:hypothetical protein OIV83_000213 [Microbotryomycetes sp. JL201]
MSGRLISPLLALALGIGSGVYIFQPLLVSYGASTGGTFKPEDDHHSAPAPPLPLTGGTLQPGKDLEGKDLAKQREEPTIVTVEVK